MPRRNDDDDRYDAYLDMRDANDEYDDVYVGECQDMDGEPYDVFIDIFDEEEEEEEGDEYADYHDARIRWSAWTSAADAHERGLLLEKEKRNVARDIENERDYILRAREARQGVCQMVPCDLDELYWLRYQYCMLADELEKYRASSCQWMTRDACGGVSVSPDPDIESGSSVAVECAEWVLANE